MYNPSVLIRIVHITQQIQRREVRVLFTVDGMSRTPVYEQIIEQAEKYIISGILPCGSQLPSVRSLSVSLGINPNTIQKAYSDLLTRGLIVSVPGKGNFVSENAIEIVRAKGREKLSVLEETVKELKLSGVEKEELYSIIESVYNKNGGGTND